MSLKKCALIQLTNTGYFLFFVSLTVIIACSHIYAGKLSNARICCCGLDFSQLFCCIVDIVPGMVLTGGTQCWVKCLPSWLRKLWVMIPNRHCDYGCAALETESLKGLIKGVLCQLASMSGNNSVKFCSPIETQPLNIISQQRTTINLHGKEHFFGAEKHDVTSLSCEALLQWHRADIYLSSQEETSIKDLSQILFYPLNIYHRIIIDS